MAARKMCFVLIKNKTKSFHVYCVINKQYCEQRETQREEMTPPSFVPTQQFKLHGFCFFGQGRRLWESKLGVTLQVRLVWDTSRDSVIRGAAIRGDLSGSHFKRREERSLVSGILFPRQWAAFLTPAELVKHHGQLSSFVIGESRQQPDVATTESVAAKPAE